MSDAATIKEVFSYWNQRLADEGLRIYRVGSMDDFELSEYEYLELMTGHIEDLDIETLREEVEAAVPPAMVGVEYCMRLREVWAESKQSRKLNRTSLKEYKDRARAYGVIDTLTSRQARAVLEAWAGACVYCDEPSVKLTLDHIEPISKNGANAAWNLVPACQSCNSSKSDMELVQWCKRRGLDLSDVEWRISAVQSRLVDVLGEDAMRGAS